MHQINIEHVYNIALKHAESRKALYLLKEMKAHSMETYVHTINVCLTSYYFSKYLGLSESLTELVFDAALVHDLGKLKVPVSILHKNGKLTPGERQVMNEHVKYSYAMTQDFATLENAAMIGCLHHERWDGNGYPLRLKGNEIPYIAQVLAIVDAWDAMVSNRSYRKGMPITKALETLLDEREMGQFNPKLVDSFAMFIGETYNL